LGKDFLLLSISVAYAIEQKPFVQDISSIPFKVLPSLIKTKVRMPLP
jgi:hypothetical protein